MTYLLVFQGEGIPGKEYFHLSSTEIPAALADQHPAVLRPALSILDSGKTKEIYIVYVRKIRESEIKKKSLYDSKSPKIMFVI